MEKNTIWAIVLSSIVLIGSMLLQNHFFPPQKVVTTEQEVVISEELENLPEQIKEIETQVVEFTSDSIPEEESIISFDEKMSWWKGDFFIDDIIDLAITKAYRDLMRTITVTALP